MIDTGIECELRPYVERIRDAFPDVKIFTERVTQDTPMEMFYFEEGETTTTREQWDTFTQLQHFTLYYIPDAQKLGQIQARLREVQRWLSANIIWIPFTRNLTIRQEDGSDVLVCDFDLWRRYRLDYPEPPKMRSLRITNAATQYTDANADHNDSP